MYNEPLPTSRTLSTTASFSPKTSQDKSQTKMTRTRTTRPQTPLALLQSLVDVETSQWNTHQECTLWNRTYASVINGRLTRDDLLQALERAALKFSAVVSEELHTNLSANLYFADELVVGELAPCWGYHQEWSWRFACLPHFVAVLKSGGNVELFLGDRELVEGRRAVGAGLVKASGMEVAEEWNRY
jgi:hypothetical protein